jgi:glycosyltransferase involved in cell wall biosynthesis
MLNVKNNASRPLITVLIDTYNQEAFIEEAVISVLRQDEPPQEVEILVVDDGSSDGTPEIVRKFVPRVRLIQKQNGGQASALNLGISEARGEIVAFLDGDDWWASSKLKAVVDSFQRNPEVELVGHGITEIRSDGFQRVEVPNSEYQFRISSITDAKKFRLLRGFLGTSRMAFRRTLLERIGPVPEVLRFEADEYLFTIGGLSADVLILDKPYTFYRVHDKNLYQLSGGGLEGMRRKQEVIATLAECLRTKLRIIETPEQIARTILECVEVEARLLQLQLTNGYPWETLSTELEVMRIFHEDSSFWQHLFSRIRLLPALFMPSSGYYRWRGRFSRMKFYQRFRERIMPLPVPDSIKRTDKRIP